MRVLYAVRVRKYACDGEASSRALRQIFHVCVILSERRDMPQQPLPCKVKLDKNKLLRTVLDKKVLNDGVSHYIHEC